jgi:hypothetical protein
MKVRRGQALSNSEKAEVLADIPEPLVQPVDDPSEPADMEIFDEAMSAFE